VQYDSSQYRVLTDFLASYEFHRGTVVDAGYDPLIERRDSINGKCVPGSDDYFASQRGLFWTFLQASYLRRFERVQARPVDILCVRNVSFDELGTGTRTSHLV
jgi:hypothetical protein